MRNRGNLPRALEFIALNDGNGDDDRLDPASVQYQISVQAIAAAWLMPPREIAEMVVNKRRHLDQAQ